MVDYYFVIKQKVRLSKTNTNDKDGIMYKKGLCVVMLAFFPIALLADVPQLINYQGRLTDAQNAARTGTANLKFEIFDAATTGTKLWGPQVFTNVPLVNGYFNIILGTTDQGGSLIGDAFVGASAFLQIYETNQNTDTPILPRQQILSAPYSIHANIADVVRDGSNGVPSGAVMAFDSDTCPTAWSEYIPAYGRFIRGIDKSGDGIDSEGVRLSGSLQDDSVESHSHSFTGETVSRGGNSGTGRVVAIGDSSNFGEYTPAGTIGNYGTSETKPKNVALLFCKKN